MSQRIQNLTATRENKIFSYEKLYNQKAFSTAFTSNEGIEGVTKSLYSDFLEKKESQEDCFLDPERNFSEKCSAEKKDKREFLIFVEGKTHENSELHKEKETNSTNGLKKEEDIPLLGRKLTRCNENKEFIRNSRIKDLNNKISLEKNSGNANTINDYFFQSNKSLVNSKLNFKQKAPNKQMFQDPELALHQTISCDLNLNEEPYMEDKDINFLIAAHPFKTNKLPETTNCFHSIKLEKSFPLGYFNYLEMPELSAFLNKRFDLSEKIHSKREKEIIYNKFFAKEPNLINIDYFQNEINLCNHLYMSLFFSIIHSDLFFNNYFINNTKTNNGLIKFSQQLNTNHQFFHEQMKLIQNLNLEINTNLKNLANEFRQRLEIKPEINLNKINSGSDLDFNNLCFENAPNFMNNNNYLSKLSKIKCGDNIIIRENEQENINTQVNSKHLLSRKRNEFCDFDFNISLTQTENKSKLAGASLYNIEKDDVSFTNCKEDNEVKTNLHKPLHYDLNQAITTENMIINANNILKNEKNDLSYHFDKHFINQENTNIDDKNPLNAFRGNTKYNNTSGSSLAQTFDLSQFNDLIRKLNRFSLRVKIKRLRKIKSEKLNNDLNKTLSEIDRNIDKETLSNAIINFGLIERKIKYFNHFINRLKLRSKYLLKSVNNVILCQKFLDNLNTNNQKLYKFLRPNDLLSFQKLKKKIIRLAKLNVSNNQNERKLIEFVNGLNSNKIFQSKDLETIITKFIANHKEKRVYYNSIQMNSNDLVKLKNLISSVCKMKNFKLKRMLKSAQENKRNFSNADNDKLSIIDFAREKNISFFKTGKKLRNTRSNFNITNSNSSDRSNLNLKLNAIESVMSNKKKNLNNSNNNISNFILFKISNDQNPQCINSETKELLKCSNKNIFYIIKELHRDYQNKIINKGAIENLISPTYKKESNIYRKILCKIVDYIRIQLFQLILENKRKFYPTNKSSNYLNKNDGDCSQKQIKSDTNHNFVNENPKNLNRVESNSHSHNDDEMNFSSTENLIYQLEQIMNFKNKLRKSKGLDKISVKNNKINHDNKDIDNDINFINISARTDLKLNNQLNKTNNSLISNKNSILKAEIIQINHDNVNDSYLNLSVIQNSKNLRSQMMNFINNCKRERINRLLRSNHFKIKCQNKSQMNHYYKKIINNTIENLFFENKEVKLTIEDSDRIIFEKMKKIPKIKKFLELKMSFLVENLYKNSYFSRKLFEITKKKLLLFRRNFGKICFFN